MPTIWTLTAVTMEARTLRVVAPDARAIGIGVQRWDAIKGLEWPAGPGGVVLMVGVGGAIDPSLAVGDVVVDGPADVVPAGCRSGAIHTVAHVVTTVAEKATLFAVTGAVAIDMEQAIVRERVAPLGMTVIGIRAISDAADDAIDPAVLRLVTDLGRPRPGVIAGTLLRRPGLVPHLRRLNRDTRLALARLGPAVRAVTEALQS